MTFRLKKKMDEVECGNEKCGNGKPSNFIPPSPSSEAESCDHFFQTCPPPDDLGEIRDRAKEFIERHQRSNRPVVMVTSGGTTVPIEKNTVRFIDNFSSGTRGSRSAEYFLEGGYAVVFLYRSSSLVPFGRHLVNHHNPLDWFTVSEEEEEPVLKFSGSHDLERLLLRVIPAYRRTKTDHTLFSVPFTDVFQYIFYLRELALLLGPMGSKVMMYLAAAVSDFYIPHSRMANHKISSSEELKLDFSHTPKMISPLVSLWVPRAFTVTFKLETDASVLMSGAKNALTKYGHQVVVANLLETCRTTVTVVAKAVTGCSSKGEGQCADDMLSDGCGQVVPTQWEALQIQLSRDDKLRGTELEWIIVSDLITRHKVHYEDIS